MLYRIDFRKHAFSSLMIKDETRYKIHIFISYINNAEEKEERERERERERENENHQHFYA